MTDTNKGKEVRHNHYWFYHHGIIQGKKAGESRIIRSCGQCGAKQMAIIHGRSWRPAKGDYLLPEHYD